MRRSGLVFSLCLISSGLAYPQNPARIIRTSEGPPAPGHSLTFEQRVAAQEAIERVSYRHQIDARRPFEAARSKAGNLPFRRNRKSRSLYVGASSTCFLLSWSWPKAAKS